MKALPILLVLLMATMPSTAFAEDWKTTDGKTFENVKVIKVEDDAVTILCKDGGALVPLSKLPPDLQKKYSYDPDKAKVAAAARAKADAENSKKLQAEMVVADKMKKDKIISEANGGTNTTTQPAH